MFAKNFKQAYQEIKEDKKYQWGKKATYIPSLVEADENWFASAFCSSDGQFTQVGDSKVNFSMQSISKVVAYAFLYNHYLLAGKEEEIEKWIGEEPSGLPFNSPSFDKDGRPHNPMVNAGAILVCTLLVNEGKTVKDFQNFFKKAASTDRADIDLPLYLEE